MEALRQDGRRVAGKMGGNVRPKVSAEAEAVLWRALEAAHHLTLAQCRDWLAAEAGVGALGVDGIVAAISVETATDDAVFTAYLDQMVLP